MTGHNSSICGCGRPMFWSPDNACITCARNVLRQDSYASSSTPIVSTASHAQSTVQTVAGQTAGEAAAEQTAAAQTTAPPTPCTAFASHGKHPFLLPKAPPITRSIKQEDSPPQTPVADEIDAAVAISEPSVKQEVHDSRVEPQQRVKKEFNGRRRRSRSPARDLAGEQRSRSPLEETLNHPYKRRIPLPCKRCKAAGKPFRNHFEHECKYLDEQDRDAARERFVKEPSQR